LTQLSFVVETDFGETPTQGAQTSLFGILKDDIDLPDPKRTYDIYPVSGSDRNPAFADQLEVTHEGRIPFLVQNGIPLVFGLGKSVKSGVSAPYTHTIQTNSELPSMVMEAVISDGTTDYLRYYKGTKINKMTLEGEEKGRLKCTLDLITQQAYKSTDTKSSITLLTTKSYRFFHTSTNLTLWDSSFARVKSFTLTIDNHLTPEWYWQDTDAEYLYEINENEQTFELRAVLRPTDMDIFDHIGVDTEFDFDLVLTRGTGDTIEFKNPTAKKCVMSEAPHPLPGKGPMEVSAMIIPKGLEIIVVDAIAAYPNET